MSGHTERSRSVCVLAFALLRLRSEVEGIPFDSACFHLIADYHSHTYIFIGADW